VGAENILEEQKEASLAYIFDPLRNTFIDDEDTSLGNKLALLDDDLEKAIREIGEKYGPDAIKTLDQLPENKPAEVEQTEQFNRFNRTYEDGGFIGGGTISGENYGDRTGFAKPQLIIGGSRTNPKFRGKYGVRTGLTVPADTLGYLGRTGEQAVFATEADAQRFIDEDIKKLFLESQASKKRSPVIEARLEKIKQIYKNLKASNPKKIYIDDILDQLEGEKSVFGTGKRGIQTEQTKIESRSNFRGNIKEALGEKIYNTLIKSPGEDPRVVDAKKAKFNKLVLDVNRGDLPILALGSEERGTKQNIKMYLTEANKKRFDKLYSKLKSITSRVSQPRQKYTADDIKNISETTVKTFDKMVKNYPISVASRTNILKAGTRFFDAKSYILAQLSRHVENGGKLFKHVSGDTIATAKFRDLTTNKLITFKNIDINDPLFKEAATVYNDIEKLKKIKIDDPRNPGETITLNKALQEGGDKLVIDHLDEVQTNPLKKLVISTQKANMSGQIKNLTEPEINAIGRGLNLSFVDNLKRYKKYAERILLNKAADPEFKIKSPTETIKEKTGTFKGEAQNIKSKMDNFKFLTNKIPGGAVVLSPLDFTLSMFSGLPLTESLASAGSYLIKDPYIGKAVNIPLAIAADTQDPEAALQKGIERGVKAEAFLQELKDRVTSGLEEGAGDQPDIDPFQAANGGRVGFSGGGAAGADDDFAAQLEYFFLNPDAELPAAKTFRETMNPVSIINDMIDPRNLPYYADRIVQSGIRIGEFGARVLPAVGQLAADLIQKPAFKIKPSTNQGYVQDYTDQPLPLSESRIEGTGIFTDFLNNLVGDEGTKVITEKTGLAKLIKDEEQKMKDERKTAGAKILADQFTLGMELTAPIFPGYKLLQAYAKSRKLPVDKTTRETMDKEIEELLTKQGTNRRNFLKATGAGGAVMIAKMLGVGDEFATVTKVAEKAAPIKPVVPQYFFTLADKIKKFGTDNTKGLATVDREAVYVYKDYELYEDLTTGNIRINKKSGDPDGFGYYEEEMVYTKGIGDESTKGTPPDEYEEFTVKADMDGKMKDVEVGLEDLDELIDELGAENISLKDLEAMGYEADMLPISVQKKLGLKETSPAKKMLKRQGADDDLPDLPF